MTDYRKLILHLSSFILFVAVAASLHALEVPPPPKQWFTDIAGIVQGTDADLLNRKLADFEQASGAQFIIYVFPSLEQESLEDFTIRAVERWKVGQKKYDNGLVLFVFVKEQKTRIEVGYGLEGSVTDAFSSRVLRDILAPRFQQRDYTGGLNAAADAIITKIRTGEEPVAPLQPRGDGTQAPEEDLDIIPALIVLFIVFFFILPMFSRGSRRGRSGCGGCFFPFFFPGGGITFGGGGFGGGGSFGGGGGFSGGGGGFGGGGASGGW